MPHTEHLYSSKFPLRILFRITDLAVSELTTKRSASGRILRAADIPCFLLPSKWEKLIPFSSHLFLTVPQLFPAWGKPKTLSTSPQVRLLETNSSKSDRGIFHIGLLLRPTFTLIRTGYPQNGWEGQQRSVNLWFQRPTLCLLSYFPKMAREEGIEPPTYWLTASRSSAELLPNAAEFWSPRWESNPRSDLERVVSYP